MRKLKTLGKLFVFPVACFACIVWIAVFVLIGMRMPNQNVGMVSMLVFAGLTLLLPWLVMAIAIGRRIGWNDDLMDGPVAKPESPEDGGTAP